MTLDPALAHSEDADRWEYALDVLASRVASLIEAERGVGPESTRVRSLSREAIQAEASSPPPPPAEGLIPWNALPESLTLLGEYLPLDEIDLAILLCAAAPALDARFERFFVVLNNDADARGPLVSTALRLSGISTLDAEARARFRPDAPLTALGLVNVGPQSRPLSSQVVTVPERVIAHLLGDAVPDPSVLRALVSHDYEPLDPSLLPDLPTISDLPAILRGRPGSAAIAQAQHFLSTNLDAAPMIVDLSMFEGDHTAGSHIARGLCREVALSGRPMIVDVRMCSGDTPVIAIIGELMDLDAPVIIVSDNRRDLGTWSRRALTLPLPTAQQRAQWWRTLRPDADPALAQIATHVDPEDLARMDASDGTSVLVSRARGGQRKSRVTTVTPSVRLQDVVLDGLPAEQLSELVDRVRYRATVLDEWKMRPGGSRGRGVTALFAGESGTGKSMSAEALAGELSVPLFSVDLASIVDKYIGETEKNLEEVFRAVENEDGVLLFDEADALFGKRSDVSDARDRYANIEVAYLLQRIESFDGLAILTTNLRANLDEAFQRRLDMIVDFPEPDAPARTAIWAKALAGFPGSFTQEDLETLAILDITGGYIRAAAISAAYKAAAQGQTVMRHHVLAGVKDEWRKSGRLNFPDHAFAGWSNR